MYTVMATLQRQKGKYWYLVESRRVKGKPRPVPIAYLGKAEDILEKLSGKKAVSSKSYEYGTVAVLDHFINNILRIDSLFNETVFGRDSNAPRRNEVSFGQNGSALPHLLGIFIFTNPMNSCKQYNAPKI